MAYKAGEKQIELNLFAEKQNLIEKLELLEQTYEKESKAVSGRSIFKYIFGGFSVGSLGASGVSWYLGDQAYTAYNSATTTNEVIEYREQVEMHNVITISTGVAAIGFTALSLINWFSKDKRPEIKKEMASVSAQIAELEAK